MFLLIPCSQYEMLFFLKQIEPLLYYILNIRNSKKSHHLMIETRDF